MVDSILIPIFACWAVVTSVSVVILFMLLALTIVLPENKGIDRAMEKANMIGMWCLLLGFPVSIVSIIAMIISVLLEL